MATLATGIARALGQPDHEVARIRLAARLHDIGKVTIPAAILNKIAPLDDREWNLIRRHPVIGQCIVRNTPDPTDVAALVRSSHERVDGRGYPDGLAGTAIPLGARIIAVCDAFDAMTNDRVYRRAMSTRSALKELRCNCGSQFDVTIVATFCGATWLHRRPGG